MTDSVELNKHLKREHRKIDILYERIARYCLYGLGFTGSVCITSFSWYPTIFQVSAIASVVLLFIGAHVPLSDEH